LWCQVYKKPAFDKSTIKLIFSFKKNSAFSFVTAGSISGAAFQMSLPINTVMQRYPALCKKYGVKKKKKNGTVIDNRLIKSVYKGLEEASGDWKIKEVKLFTEKRFVSLVMNNEKIIVSDFIFSPLLYQDWHSKTPN
jgi:hypothetical protein